MKKFLIILSIFFIAISTHARITLEQCVEKARQNYPLIKKYALIEHTSAVNLSNINKSWLPNIGISAQATVQNAVPAFPEIFRDIISQMGQKMKGMGKFQYKAAVELNQTIWDGGESRSRRQQNSAHADRQNAALDVEMYAITERIEDLYFGYLLYSQNISQMKSTIALLEANADEMREMLDGGLVMKSDVDMVEAQILSMSQQVTKADASRSALLDMLGIFIGESLEGKELVKPSAEIPTDLENNRPELNLFEKRLLENTISRQSIATSLMPKAEFFGSAYYGYPGFDYFKSMRDRVLSLNLMAGIKLSWSLTPFYTKKNRYTQLKISDAEIENDKEVFIFNTRLQTASILKEIESMRKVIADDDKIVALRGNVRKAAESQLQNGIINATDLLTRITDENDALLTKGYNEIQLLRNIYKLKYILYR